jgi:hypothetical protein
MTYTMLAVLAAILFIPVLVEGRASETPSSNGSPTDVPGTGGLGGRGGRGGGGIGGAAGLTGVGGVTGGLGAPRGDGRVTS